MTNDVATNEGHHQRVLLISYLFPPIGGSGVQRNLKLVKDLPEFGWAPSVLTVKDILYYDYDQSLLEEVPPRTPIIRTGSLDPLRMAHIAIGRFSQSGNSAPQRVREGSPAVRAYRAVRRTLLFPDAQAGWIPFAYRRGLRAIREQHIDVIVASVPPVSSAIVASLLARKTGIPYVLDFRDGWTDDPYLERPTKLHERAHQVLERRTIRRAAAVTVYGKPLADQLQQRYPEKSASVRVIRNGYDPTDFVGLKPIESPPGRFRIVYVGSLYPYHGPNMRCLVEAVEKLPTAQRAKLDIHFVGQADVQILAQLSKSTTSDVIKFLGYMSHTQALSHLVGSNACMLFLPPGDTTSLTGKAFEYIAAGRPIVGCVEPKGACAELLREAGHKEWVVAPGDASGMARAIMNLIDTQGHPREFISAESFSRRHSARLLAGVLDSITSRPQPSRPQGELQT